MSLIKEVGELRKFIPATVTVDLDQLQPFIDNQATKQRLRKNILGPALFDELKADYDDDNILEDSIYWELLLRSQMWLANYALLRSIPTGIVNIGNSGINQTVSDSVKPLSPIQVDLLIDSQTDSSDEALEDLLVFLEDNVDTFEDWKDAPSYTLIKEAFIASALEFHEEYAICESRSTFLSFKTFMLEVQRIQIKSILTPDLYDSMIEKIEANDFSEPEQVILPWIRKAIAYLTIYSSIPHISIRITGEGLQVFTRPDRTNTKARTTATEKRIDDLKAACKTQGDYYLSLIRNYLIENADEFPNYPQDTTEPNLTGGFKTEGTGNISLL
jgi:hypothetical protein